MLLFFRAGEECLKDMKTNKEGSQEYSERWEEELVFQWSDGLLHLSHAFGGCLWILDFECTECMCWGRRMVLNSPRYMYSKQIRRVWEGTSWTILPLSSLSLTVRLVLCAYLKWAGIYQFPRVIPKSKELLLWNTGPSCNLHCLGHSRCCKRHFVPFFLMALEIRSTFANDASSLP